MALLVQVSVCRSLCCGFNNIQVLHVLYCNFDLPPSAPCHSPPVSPCLSLISVIRSAFAVVVLLSLTLGGMPVLFGIIERQPFHVFWPLFQNSTFFFYSFKSLEDIRTHLMSLQHTCCCLARGSTNFTVDIKKDDTSLLPLIIQKRSQNWALPSAVVVTSIWSE